MGTQKARDFLNTHPSDLWECHRDPQLRLVYTTVIIKRLE